MADPSSVAGYCGGRVSDSACLPYLPQAGAGRRRQGLKDLKFKILKGVPHAEKKSCA
jgi:hypothetical protein